MEPSFGIFQKQEKDTVVDYRPGRLVFDFYATLMRHRRLIVRLVLLGVTIGIVAALLSPKWYKSTASIFPAEKTDLLGGLEGINSLAKSFSPGRALSALGGNTETDRYMAILKSGAVLGAVIEKFDLVHVYDITSYPGEKTVKELLSNTEFAVENEGDITVSVYDKDPQRAADMANYFVQMLNKTNSELQVQNARGNRLFIEQRYKKNLADLAAAEDSLRVFQQRYGVIALPEQTEASIKAAAELAGQLVSREVQAGVARRTESASNPSVMGLQVEIEELRRKLRDLNDGLETSSDGLNILVPFRKMPELGSQYVRKMREVEIQYKILQFLTPIYEQAKVEENRQTPSVLVLDHASPAERKAKPKLTLYALMGFVLSAFLALLLVGILEGIRRIRAVNPEGFNQIWRDGKADWFGLRPRRPGIKSHE